MVKNVKWECAAVKCLIKFFFLSDYVWPYIKWVSHGFVESMRVRACNVIIERYII